MPSKEILVEPGTVVREVTEADVLLRAADLIEEWGWAQRSIGMPAVRGERGPLCYLGAIVQARLDYGEKQPPDDPFGFEWGCEPSPFDLPCEAYGFNDAPERTREEVTAALRLAATQAAPQPPQNSSEPLK